MIKFPSIDQFRIVKRNVEHAAQFVGIDPVTGDEIMNRCAPMPKIEFVGTVKIHGCNAGVQFVDGKIVCQSREREITIENDNYGFARFISELPADVIENMKNIVNGDGVLYFEWCGKGIQQKVAVNEIHKCAVLIAAWVGSETEGKFIEIENIPMANDNRVFNIFQFGKFVKVIDFNKPELDINSLNDITLAVEKECPVGKFFGISGIGEGVVWRPSDINMKPEKFCFKVKGAEHSGSKVTKLATVDVEKVKNLTEFAEKHAHEGRLMQGWNWLAENNHEQTEKSTGLFLKWVVGDIFKEEKDVISASGLSEKEVPSAIQKVARLWFFHKING